MNRGQRFFKRTIDVVVASALSIILLPLMGVIAVMIRFDSRGPALFISERIGQDKRPFRMVKFRTMIDGAHLEYHELRESHLHAVNGVLYKDEKDLRITRFGKLLRTTSLDELPQLWNVVSGEMTLVGPRPAFAVEVEEFEERANKRFSVKPGITGLWQVSGRSLLSHDDAIDLDLYYVKHQSIRFDLVILAKTIPAVLSRRGAF